MHTVLRMLAPRPQDPNIFYVLEVRQGREYINTIYNLNITHQVQKNIN
jgi:hypothetical protein